MLYHGGNSAVCRQQAGVQLKNFLYTNDESLRAQYEERWLNIPEDVRVYTKQNVVGALGTEVSIGTLNLVFVIVLLTLYFSPPELPAERGGAVYPHDRGGGAAARLLAGADHHAGGQRDQPRQHRDHEGEHAAGPRLRLPGRRAQVDSRYSTVRYWIFTGVYLSGFWRKPQTRS